MTGVTNGHFNNLLCNVSPAFDQLTVREKKIMGLLLYIEYKCVQDLVGACNGELLSSFNRFTLFGYEGIHASLAVQFFM